MRFAVIAFLVAACSSPSKPPTPPPVEPTPVEPAPVEPTPADPIEQAPPAIDAGAAVEVDAAPALAADGASCFAHSDCASGVCEGEGCDDSHPGTCAPAQRGCTKDLRTYCGCDGKTFKASGSCPRQRFAAKNACVTGANRPAGAFCLKATDCASKICEGLGCDDSTPGRCVENVRPCTRDMRHFCTCDGRTISGSGSCPGVRYAKKQACG